MITEFALAGLSMYAYDKFKNRHINKIKRDWNNFMLELGLKNKSEQTYEILEIYEKHYGYDCIISIPQGKNIEEFSKKTSNIQSYLQSSVIIQLSERKNSIYMRVIKDLDSASKTIQIKYKWYKIMNTNKLRNEDYDTFTIKQVIEKDLYGFDMIVSIPNGLSYDKLNTIKATLESNFNAVIQCKWDKFKNEIYIQVIKKIMNDKYKFKPTKVNNAMQVYTGYSVTYEELISNMFTQPHILVSGQTGSGKTEEIRLLLTNLIHNFDDKELELYFSDLSDMCDFECFQNCKQTRYYAKTIEKSQILFKRLYEIYKLRFDIFVKEKCKNIKEYNNKHKDNPMTIIYLVLDEFADYYPQSEKVDKQYKIKMNCYNMLKGMTRKFRKAGMFLIVGIQRPDTTVLDPSLRSNLCTKIGFSQNTDSSSLVASDSTELTGLEAREGLFMYGSKREWFKSLYIDDKLIKQYIKDSIEKEHRYIDIFKDISFKEYLNQQYHLCQDDNMEKVITMCNKHRKQQGLKPIKTKNKIYI